jgi:alternate signal-mediated exported protein
MASNSKKRRRVLGVSCILAALIIASSSFAWFTSKDEVTNRLSANADYGVSIVESFAPPENWLPGQQVNKDVYAVNTGNVAAFVEETVSGVLSIVTEEAYTTVENKPDADSVKLSAAEVYVIEDGSYLVYKPAASNLTLGNKVVAMNPDFADKTKYASGDGDFGPDAAGLYVFRRYINVDGTSDPFGAETFKYVGYYYDGQDFYEVTDLKVTPDNVADYAADEIFTDGNLADVTSYKFVKEVKERVVPNLVFEAKDENHPNRLVATYKTETAAGEGAISNLAKDYDDALVAYEDAVEEYKAALRDKESTDGTAATANSNLQDALDALRAARNALKTAEDDRDAKKTAKEKAEQAVTAAENALEQANQAVAAAQADINDRQRADNEAKDAVDAAKLALYGLTNGGTSTPSNADNPGEGEYTKTSPYGEWMKAKAAREAADANADGVGDVTPHDALQNLLDAYIAANATSGEAGFANCHVVTGYDTDNNPIYGDAVTLGNVTYDQLLAMNLVNQGDPRYNYYELVVTEKLAEKEKNKKEAELRAANEAKALTAQQLADSKAALYGNADGGAGSLINDTTVTTTAGNYTATSIYGKKKAAEKTLDDANKDLYGNADGGAGSLINDTTVTTTAGNYTADSKYGKYMAALDEVDAKMIDLYGFKNGGEDEKVADSVTYDETNPDATKNKFNANSKYGKWFDANAAYTAASSAAGTDDTQLTAARNHLSQATQALAEAREAYENAANTSAGEFKININLSDDVVTTGGTADKWQLLPCGANTEGDVGTTANFYYTSILGAGETTTKLIDSVELDSSVTKEMFKRFDFDLNVGLKSAQIALDSDGETILTTAADNTLDASATLADNKNVDTAITWSATAPETAKNYKVTAARFTTAGTQADTDTANVKIKKLDTAVKVGDEYYQYEITQGTTKYYGNALTNGTVFKATKTVGDNTVLDDDNKVELKANATVDNT